MNVLVAVCGSLAIGPNIISLLKDISYINTVVGIDINEDNPGKYLADKFYRCPRTNTENFIPFVKQLCIDECIDIILCTSTQNSLIPLKTHEAEFNKIGVQIPGTQLDKLLVANDKGSMLVKLGRSGLPCPSFCTPTTADEFNMFTERCKSIIVKPRVSSGSRGFRFLKKDHKLTYNDIIGKSGDLSKTVDIDDYRNIVQKDGNFSDILMMENLTGQDYSVYVLAKNGTSLITIPFKRVNPKEGVSLVSEIDMDPYIIKYVESVVEEFELDWIVNIQLKISTDGIPLVYEINPRLAGSVILTKGAGCNLLEYGLNSITGKDIQMSIPQHSKMIRYYTEILT